MEGIGKREDFIKLAQKKTKKIILIEIMRSDIDS